MTLREELQALDGKSDLFASEIKSYPHFFRALTHYYHQIILRDGQRAPDHVKKIYVDIQNQLILIFLEAQLEEALLRILIEALDDKSSQLIHASYRPFYDSLEHHLSAPEKTEKSIQRLIEANKNKTDFFCWTQRELALLSEYFSSVQIKERPSSCKIWMDYLQLVGALLEIPQRRKMLSLIVHHSSVDERKARLEFLADHPNYKNYIPEILEEHQQSHFGISFEQLFGATLQQMIRTKNNLSVMMQRMELNITQLYGHLHSWIDESERHWSTGLLRPIRSLPEDWVLQDIIGPRNDEHINLERAGAIIRFGYLDQWVPAVLPEMTGYLNALMTSRTWDIFPWAALTIEAGRGLLLQKDRLAYYWLKQDQQCHGSPYYFIHLSIDRYLLSQIALIELQEYSFDSSVARKSLNAFVAQAQSHLKDKFYGISSGALVGSLEAYESGESARYQHRPLPNQDAPTHDKVIADLRQNYQTFIRYHEDYIHPWTLSKFSEEVIKKLKNQPNKK